MKYILKITLLMATVICGIGCTTGYWKDRGRDARDVLTCTLGIGVGGKAKVGPFQGGVLIQSDAMGIRGGEVLSPQLMQTTSLSPAQRIAFDIETFAWGGEIFFPYRSENTEGYRAKDLSSHTSAFPFYKVARSLIGTAPKNAMGNWEKRKHVPHFYTQIEAVVALGPSLRIGFNPVELLDFLLGFTGIDIYSDDLEQRKKKKIEQADVGPDGPNP